MIAALRRDVDETTDALAANPLAYPQAETLP